MFRFTALATFLLVGAALCDAKLFSVADSEGAICILLDIEFFLHFGASQNGVEIDSARVGQDTKDLEVSGDCDKKEIILALRDAMTYDFSFKDTNPDEVQVGRTATIVPKNLFFSPHFNKFTKNVVFEDVSPLDLSDNESSWVCRSTLYNSYADVKEDVFTFSANNTNSYIKVQAYNVVNNTFSDPQSCPQDMTTEFPGTTTEFPGNSTTPSKASSFDAPIMLPLTLCLLVISVMF